MLARTNDRVNKNDKKGGYEEIKFNFLTASLVASREPRACWCFPKIQFCRFQTIESDPYTEKEQTAYTSRLATRDSQPATRV